MFELQENIKDRSVKPQPLTDVELDRLSEVLKRFSDKRAMNLEQLDGFLSALICCPDLVPPQRIPSRDMGRQYRFGGRVFRKAHPGGVPVSDYAPLECEFRYVAIR